MLATLLAATAFVCHQAPDAIDPPFVKSDDFPVEIQKKLLTATPRLKSLQGDYGTATVVSIREGSAYMLTAFHVIKSTSEFECEFFPVEKNSTAPPIAIKPITILAKYPSLDLSLIKVNLKELKSEHIKMIGVIPIAKPFDRPKHLSLPVNGLSIGCNYGATPTCQAEIIRARQLVKRNNDLSGSFFWLVDNPPVPGRSGGPLISKSGQLIGVCVAAKEKTGYFAYLDEIHAQLKIGNYSFLWETK